MDATFMNLLACPMCRGELGHCEQRQLLVCSFDRVGFPIEDGIPIMLATAAVRLPADDQLVQRKSATSKTASAARSAVAATADGSAP